MRPVEISSHRWPDQAAPVQAFEVAVDGLAGVLVRLGQQRGHAGFQFQEAGQVRVFAQFAFDGAGMQLQHALPVSLRVQDAIVLTDPEADVTQADHQAMINGGRNSYDRIEASRQVMAARRDRGWGSHFITDALGQLPSSLSCRSELAHEKTKGTAFIQDVRFIVAVSCEQAAPTGGASCGFFSAAGFSLVKCCAFERALMSPKNFRAVFDILLASMKIMAGHL